MTDVTEEQVTVEALLCVLDLVPEDEVPVKGCVTDPATAVGIGDGTYFLVTLLARGEADCANGNCTSEALVSEQVSNFGASAGGRAGGTLPAMRSMRMAASAASMEIPGSAPSCCRNSAMVRRLVGSA